MSDIDDAVARYTTGNLRERVHAALRAAGHDPAMLKPDDLNEGDHFHLGGRDTTDWIAGILGIGEGVRVLDVGSGLGGPARHFAVLGARVTGVDVTKEFTDLATELNQACGLEGSIEMLNRPGQQTGLEGSSFDVAVLMHVGMSIADKTSLFAEILQLLRPGGVLGVYEPMGTNELSYPVPWADVPSASNVEPREDYREHLEAVGFDLKETIDRTQEALSYADSVLPRAGIALSAPLVMGENPAQSMKHVIDAVRAELLNPTLLVARKPSQL